MNAPEGFLTAKFGEAEIRVPRDVAILAYLEQLVEQRRPVSVGTDRAIDTAALPFRLAFQQDCAPKIGEARRDGIYAGLTLHDDAPCELILLPGKAERLDWPAAMAWAKERGGELPSRFDALVLLKNLPGEFEKDWYWLSEQHAEDGDYAWYQGFGYGTQDYGGKSYEGRARAVRRVPI